MDLWVFHVTLSCTVTTLIILHVVHITLMRTLVTGHLATMMLSSQRSYCMK